MIKNYFDHDIQVKYVDNLLRKNKEWDWFIDYVETNFESDLQISSSDDFWSKYYEISDLLLHLCKINEITDTFSIKKEWLRTINQIALFSIGYLEINDLNLNNDFIRILVLYIYSAKIVNEKMNTEYFIYTDIFQQRNVFEIIDVSGFILEKEFIYRLIDCIKIDFTKERELFKNNINGVFYPPDEISPFILSLCESYNAFSYENRISNTELKSWEERYIAEISSSEYINKLLNPIITYRNGNGYPDLRKYTHDIIKRLKGFFNDTAVMFLVESIDYVLYGTIPSRSTIDKHFELLSKNIDEYNESKGFLHLKCSSLEFVISFWNDDKIDINSSKEIYFRALAKIDNIMYFAYLEKNNAPITKKIRNALKQYRLQKAQRIRSISNLTELYSYMTDEEIVSVVDKDVFYLLSDKFEELLASASENEGVIISSAFLSYLTMLIKIKNNKGIVPREISAEIILIRSLWKEKYYYICSKSMQVISDSCTFTNEQINGINSIIINSPSSFVNSFIKLSDEELIDKMATISEHAIVYMFTSYIISEDFPFSKKIFIDDNHPVNSLISNTIERIKTQFSYKFLNDMEVGTYLYGLYKNLENIIRLYFSLFNNTEELYSKIKKENPSYRFVDYSDAPTLAHLTQLFPIIESKIRELGEIFAISPICEELDKCYKLKEPSSVLLKIMKYIFEETNELKYISDYFFIYFTLYAENGLNIRNDCIHGNGYNINEAEITYAFKIALFCLNLIEYKINSFSLIFENKDSK